MSEGMNLVTLEDKMGDDTTAPHPANNTLNWLTVKNVLVFSGIAFVGLMMFAAFSPEIPKRAKAKRR